MSEEAINADRPNILDPHKTGLTEPSFGRVDPNMQTDLAFANRQRRDDQQPGRTVVEEITGNDQAWSYASLFMTSNRVKVYKPDAASRQMG
ncbi:hypothetical protein BH23CHL2_BH23CHL2_35160 [soil metagenome]